MAHPTRLAVTLITAGVLVAGCSNSAGTPEPEPSKINSRSAPAATPTPAPASPSAAPSPDASPTVEDTLPPAEGAVTVDHTVAEGLPVPWGLALLPDGERLMITGRDNGRIFMINLASGRRTPVGRIDAAVGGGSSGGEGGLLGLALSPQFDQDQQLFVYYTSEQDNRIARYSYHPDRDPGDQLSDGTVIVDGIPSATYHNGGRIAFGPDGLLYATTGEAGNPPLAQDLDSLGGKILRMTTDGEPAEDNPDPDSLVWSYGHRNVQGLAWDSEDRLWASEFGNQSTDELNLIEPGNNYGWPDAEGSSTNDDFTDPVAEWGTDEDSPSGIAYAGGSIWMAALQGERLWRIPLDGASTLAEPEDFLVGEYGRLRSVLAIDDDTILVSTSNTDGRGDPGDSDDRLLALTVR